MRRLAIGTVGRFNFMVIDSFKTWILTSDLNDPALSVLLFIGIVLLLYAGIGIVLKSPNILLGTGIYALTGALFVYLGFGKH